MLRTDADSERGLSSAAAAYRRAEPYLSATSTLTGSVAMFTALGYVLDRWMGHDVQWLLITGSVIGIGVGFLGFFRKVLRADARARAELPRGEPSATDRERHAAAQGRGGGRPLAGGGMKRT